jgi:hypothetical protein
MINYIDFKSTTGGKRERGCTQDVTDVLALLDTVKNSVVIFYKTNKYLLLRRF